METFDLGFYHKARVWLSELPDRHYHPIDILERVQPVARLGTSQVKRAAIELFRSTCGPSSYGLLGAELTPDDSGQLVIQVLISSDEGEPIRDSLAFPHDQVLVGLPVQYAGNILDGAINASANAHPGSGILRFNCAAHAVIGSSRAIFRQLAVAIVHLLAHGTESVTESELAGYLGLSHRH